MRTFAVYAKIDNGRYEFHVPPFEVRASNWRAAMSHATDDAIRVYKLPRGRTQRPVGVTVQLREGGLRRFEAGVGEVISVARSQ